MTFFIWSDLEFNLFELQEANQHRLKQICACNMKVRQKSNVARPKSALRAGTEFSLILLSASLLSTCLNYTTFENHIMFNSLVSKLDTNPIKSILSAKRIKIEDLGSAEKVSEQIKMYDSGPTLLHKTSSL